MVRTRNEEAGIRAALRSLRSQTVGVEIVLVDSGSTDATLELAEPLCDRIVHLTPQDFSYGRALNVGVAEAGGSILFALSAHCAAPDPDWVARTLRHYADPEVGGVFGTDLDPRGRPLTTARRVSMADVAANPLWGFSNHASSWRRAAWERIPFDESMAACEDKEWMWRALEASWAVVVDPSLHVPTSHRRDAGVRALWRREVREHEAVARALDFPVANAAGAVRTWWTELPGSSPRPLWQRRLSPWRAAEVFGGYIGERRGARRRDATTVRAERA